MSFDLEMDFAGEMHGKQTTKCDSCKDTIDTAKPKPAKGADGKAKPQLNPAIQAKLESPVDSGELKDFHFCDERCLLDFLQARYKKSK